MNTKFEADPGLDDAVAAFARLRDAGVTVVCDMEAAGLRTMAGGNPSYAPKRYSPAEIRMARAILVLRAALLGAGR